MDILGQSALVLALTSFAFGFSVLARNVRNKLFISFAILSTLISVWALTFTLDRLWQNPWGGLLYRAHLLLNVWLGPVAVSFISSVTRVNDRLTRAVRDISLTLAAALTLAVLGGFDTLGLIEQAILFAPLPVVLLIGWLVWIDHAQGRWRLIYIGGLMVLGLTTMDHVPELGRVLPSLGNALLTIYLYLLSQAVLQQRLLNFSAMISRFFVLLAVAFTLTILYSLLVGWIENSPGLFFLNSFIASFLILMLLEPLRSTVHFFTARLITKRDLRLAQVLGAERAALGALVDMSSFAQAIARATQLIFAPEEIRLYILRPETQRFRLQLWERVAPEGDASPARELPSPNPLIEHAEALAARRELTLVLEPLIENERDRTASDRERRRFQSLLDELRALGGNLFIPLIITENGEDRGLGFIVARIVGPPETWGGHWGFLPSVSEYYDSAARTLKSMDVFVRAREKERLAALGEMAAGLAHEIRNPLGAIRGAAQLLQSGESEKLLRVIVEESDRLNHVVTQFLDYAKPFGAAGDERHPISLSALARKSIEAVETSRRGQGQAVPAIRLVGQEKPAMVIGSEHQLRQVLENLLRNAIRATEGRPDPLIRVEVSEPGSEALLTVEDNGVGISAKNLERIFIPFFTTTPSGTGLGLAISQRIIEAHRGRLEVAAEEGRFARFSVVLPRAP